MYLIKEQTPASARLPFLVQNPDFILVQGKGVFFFCHYRFAPKTNTPS